MTEPGTRSHEDASMRPATLATLNTRSPIWHAVVLIAAYIALVNIGDWLSALIGVPNFATSVVLIALSISLIGYIRTHGWVAYYGLAPRRTSPVRSAGTERRADARPVSARRRGAAGGDHGIECCIAAPPSFPELTSAPLGWCDHG